MKIGFEIINFLLENYVHLPNYMQSSSTEGPVTFNSDLLIAKAILLEAKCGAAKSMGLQLHSHSYIIQLVSTAV